MSACTFSAKSRLNMCWVLPAVQYLHKTLLGVLTDPGTFGSLHHGVPRPITIFTSAFSCTIQSRPCLRQVLSSVLIQGIIPFITAQSTPLCQICTPACTKYHEYRWALSPISVTNSIRLNMIYGDLRNRTREDTDLY